MRLSSIRILPVLLLLVITLASPRQAFARQDTAPIDDAETQGRGDDQMPPRALFSDGFEATGDLSLWSGEAVLDVEEAAGYGESFGARGISSGAPAFAESRLRAPSDEVYARLRFRLNSRGENAVSLLRLRTVGGRPILTVTVDMAGRLGYVADETGTAFASGQVISLSTWYEIQVHLVVHGNESRADVWLNDVAVPDLSQGLGLGSDRIGRVELGDNTAGRSFDVNFDDIIVDDARIVPSQEPDPISGTLVVRTLPALAGIRFVLDGETFVTDEKGVARIKVRGWSADLRQRIQVPNSDTGVTGNGATATFWGWESWIGSRDHDVSAFFDLSYPTSLEFVDGDDNPVPPSRVDSVTLRSSVGQEVTLTGKQLGQPQLLPGSRVVPSREGRQSRNFEYSVQNVMIDGSNVVNTGQHRFEAGSSGPWKIPVLMYSMTVSAQDALLGSATGDLVQVVFPDGHVQELTLGPDRVETLDSLPRGEYQLSVIGAGISPPRPIMLSRNQLVELEVVTNTDIGILVGLAGSVGLGLLLAGRPGIVTFPFRLYRRWRTTGAHFGAPG